MQKACGVADLRLSDYGIKREDLPRLASYAREIMGGLFEVDPCDITQQDVEAILLASYR